MKILKNNILTELDSLIESSCRNPEEIKEFKDLHIALLKKYYKATTVQIDYQRNRIKMDVIQDESMYDPMKINTYMPTVYTNLMFINLKTFLQNSLDYDNSSLGFYTQLLRSFKHKTAIEVA